MGKDSNEPAFGDYFRTARIDCGFTLREFCREYGFDAGNISRLERGLSPAPQGQAIRKAYAEALGLEDGTAEWQRFMDLAAAYSGTIPEDIMGDETMLSRLPLLFRALREEE